MGEARREALPRKWVDQVRRKKPCQRLILDMDSSVRPTHGDQEGPVYNPWSQGS